MKRSIPLLIVVGLAAALCAAVLVTTLRTDRRETTTAEPEAPGEVNVLAAGRDMDAMTVLQAEDITTDLVGATHAPSDHLSHSIEAIGRALAVPVHKGQALTSDLFVTEGTGVHLASTLQKGMRAMSISLADYSGLEGLLYPGAIVDVLATFRRVGSEASRAEPVSASLMRKVMVLAIGEHSVVSDDKNMPNLGTLKRGRRRMVTLAVTPKQAEVLQLAMEHGTVSLSLRNPTDADRIRASLTGMGELYRAQSPSEGGFAAALASAFGSPRAMAIDESVESAAAWTVTILRGGVVEIKQFAMKVVAKADEAGRQMTNR